VKTFARQIIAIGGLALSLLTVFAPAAIAPARAAYVVAPDVVVLLRTNPAAHHHDLGALWRKQLAFQFRVFTSPTWALLEQISHRARSDIVIARRGSVECSDGAPSHQAGDATASMAQSTRRGGNCR